MEMEVDSSPSSPSSPSPFYFFLIFLFVSFSFVFVLQELIGIIVGISVSLLTGPFATKGSTKEERMGRSIENQNYLVFRYYTKGRRGEERRGEERRGEERRGERRRG